MHDVIIVGAGVFGLSVAWALKRRGQTVLVMDPSPGGGPSGGIVGALTPHAPTRWRSMMAFQFKSLMGWPEHAAHVERASRLSIGYVRSGRLTPLQSAKERSRAEEETAAAPGVWGNDTTMKLYDSVPSDLAPWLDPDTAPFGVMHDTVSAHVDPRRYVNALTALLEPEIRRKKVDQIVPGHGVKVGDVTFKGRHVVVAAGWETWTLTARFAPYLTGQPVKGQAAILHAPGLTDTLPLLYQHGLYVIPRRNGHVAIGSTSEKQFADPLETDEALDGVVERAARLCPALRGAPVIERWAGLRPKPPGREPVVGPVPDVKNLWIASGGYKISFGIAHQIGEALADMIMNRPSPQPVPDTFLPSAHT